MLASTTLRIEHKILNDIDKRAAQRHLDRGTYMRQLIMRAYEAELLDVAIERYKEGKISIGELAEKTNRSLWEIMEILKQRKIQSNLTLEDVQGS